MKTALAHGDVGYEMAEDRVDPNEHSWSEMIEQEHSPIHDIYDGLDDCRGCEMMGTHPCEAIQLLPLSYACILLSNCQNPKPGQKAI